MAAKLKNQVQAGGGANGGQVVALPSRCAAEGCSKGSDLQNFCKEHYAWFKWGLITKEGKKPVDFDKKYQAYIKHAS